jgi:prevent-host-death family protein
MTDISLADAKARLSELVEKAASGEAVCITRRGKPVARLTTVARRREPVDAAALRALTESMPRQTLSAAQAVREMRDNDRY